MDNNNNNLSNPPPPQPQQQQQPPTDPTTTTTTTTTTNHHSNSSKENINSRDQFLRHLTHLNKLSHKISKPTTTLTRPSPSEPPLHPPPQQQQPPVYNISKSDFRDVVQRLTGSPAHPPPSSAAPSPIHAPKPNSSRLQRIRPPPLAQLPPLLRPTGSGSGFGPGMAPLSPLPPLPSYHGAAESPISAYMRFLNSAANQNMMFPPPDNLENVPPPQTQTQTSSIGGASSFMPPPPSSPLPFGCLPSPKSPCQLLSPNLHLSMSPTVSGAPSPK